MRGVAHTDNEHAHACIGSSARIVCLLILCVLYLYFFIYSILVLLSLWEPDYRCAGIWSIQGNELK